MEPAGKGEIGLQMMGVCDTHFLSMLSTEWFCRRMFASIDAEVFTAVSVIPKWFAEITGMHRERK